MHASDIMFKASFGLTFKGNQIAVAKLRLNKTNFDSWYLNPRPPFRRFLSPRSNAAAGSPRLGRRLRELAPALEALNGGALSGGRLASAGVAFWVYCRLLVVMFYTATFCCSGLVIALAEAS